MQHFFDISIAEKYGMELAVFLKNIAYWIVHNQANEIHFHDGRYWTYNSNEAFAKIFSYWSPSQIRRIIEAGIEYGLLMKGNYNKVQYDRTNWYSLTDEGHKLLNISILRNRQMDSSDSSNGSDEIVKPIPDNKPAVKPHDKTKRAATCSVNINKKEKTKKTYYPEDFFPDDERRELLSQHARRTNNTDYALLKKFEEVSKKYKTRTVDWQLKLKEFLEAEMPKRTYEDSFGQKRTYDGNSLNY